jgi:hypothetical protein
MVKGGAFPGIGAMAGRALPIEVIGGLILGVARLAVRRAHCLMIEGGVIPITGSMAI